MKPTGPSYSLGDFQPSKEECWCNRPWFDNKNIKHSLNGCFWENGDEFLGDKDYSESKLLKPSKEDILKGERRRIIEQIRAEEREKIIREIKEFLKKKNLNLCYKEENIVVINLDDLNQLSQ